MSLFEFVGDKSINPIWKEHVDMVGRIYVSCDFLNGVGQFIESSWRLNRLYLKSNHDYMPVLQLPHIMARKTWSRIMKDDIVGNDFYVDWECAGNSIQFTTTDVLTFYCG